MDGPNDLLACILQNTPDDVPVDIRVFLVRSSDLELLETFLDFTSDGSVRGGLDQGYISLRATGPQIKNLAAHNAVLKVEFDVHATDEPMEDMPPGGRAAERYREFISGRYPDTDSLLGDSLEEEPDPDPD